MHNSSYFFRPLMLVAAFALLVLVGTARGETGYQDSGPFSLNTLTLTPVDDIVPIPLVNHLAPCHPNPFNPRTAIKYRLAKAGDVHLAVYDLKGRLVRTLQAGVHLSVGEYEAVWDGRNSLGQTAAAGIYLCRLKVGGFVANQRMTLIK